MYTFGALHMTSAPQDAHRVAACLRNGAWKPTNQSFSLKWMRRPPTLVESPGCARLRQISFRERFTGEEAQCGHLLHSSLCDFHERCDFRERLSAGSHPLAIFLLGDSLSANIYWALRNALRANPKHLAGIRLVGSGKLAMIPPDVEAVLRIIDSLPFPRDARPVLLVGPGNWYNLQTSHCNPALCANEQQQNQALHALNDTHPQNTKHLYRQTYEWSQYDYARTAAGLNTPREFVRDTAVLLDALQTWRNRNPAAIVAWFEAPPQHFKSTLGSERTGCTLSQRPFLRNPEEEQRPLPMEVLGLCFTEGGANVGNGTRLADCAADSAVMDWRNKLALPLVRQHDLPVIALAAGLRHRGDLHYGSECIYGPCMGDCTHWCEASVASVHLSTAVFSTLAAMVLPPQY